MKIYILTSAFLFGMLTSSAQTTTAIPFQDEIDVFVKNDSIQMPAANSILFVGSSSFNYWKDISNYFPGYPIINRGFGGSSLTDIIYFNEETILKYKPKQIYIYCGENVYFNVNCVVLDCAKVTIGSNVFFAPGVQLYTATHPLDAELRKTLENALPITIGDDCWIGGNTVICPGITIGNGCVIGAGSVVTKNIPDNSLAVGNPAKVIRKLNQ